MSTYLLKRRTRRNTLGSSFVGNNQQKIAVTFGKAIKRKRKEAGLTQTELATMAQINRSHLSEVERGLANISLEKASQLAKILGCRLNELI